MQPRSKKFLEDARRAAELVAGFCARRSRRDLEQDPLFNAGVQRQFEIIGEALNRLARIDPDTASRITHLQQIIAFRNVLIHGYDIVDLDLIWEAATIELPLLLDELTSLLREN